MELVKEYVNLQPKEDSQQSFHSFNPYEITVSIDGQEIGTTQAILYDKNFIQHTQEQSLLGILHPELFKELVGGIEKEQNRSRTFTYDWKHHILPPNREERRMKSSRKRGEEYKNEYRKGLHQMMGGKKSRWN